VKEMPFGMDPRGWFAWPYMAYWMRRMPPWYAMPWLPFPPLTKEEEESYLQEQINAMEAEISQMKKRLEELKKEK
jgi:hypothetical protein